MSSLVTIKKPYKIVTTSQDFDKTVVKSFRIRKTNIKLIENACNKLGTKFSTFVGYCAVEVAKAIRDEENGI